MAYEQNRGGGQQQPRKKPKAPVDLQKLAMSVPCPTAQGQWSSLVWGVANDNISLTLYTNDPSEKDSKDANYGKIQTKLPMPTFFAFLKIMHNAIVAKGEYKRGIEGLSWFGFGGTKRETPKVDCELIVGKDVNGLMSIMLTAANRPKIVFHFHPKNPTHRFKHSDGNMLDEAETSVLYASGYYEMLKLIVTNDMLSKLMIHAKPGDYEPRPEPKFGGGGGGYNGGGGQRPQGGGGQQNNYGNRREGGDSGGSSAPPARAPAPVNDDDDIPY
jgi:hypothetical protein